MTGEALAPQVADHLQRVVRMEGALRQTLAQESNDVVGDQLKRMYSVAGQHVHALKALAEDRGLSVPDAPRQAQPEAAAAATRLEQAASAAAGLAAAYSALYATARLLFEGSVCEIANRHASEWIAELGNASEALTVAAIGDLVADGETCHCICPACGIGACLCMRNSIETVRTQWGRPGFEASEGIELRIPPRPHSQLADAGLRQGDRIVAIDGEVVHDNRELQQALRRGDIGQPRHASVMRGGSDAQISVARVSDLL